MANDAADFVNKAKASGIPRGSSLTYVAHAPAYSVDDCPAVQLATATRGSASTKVAS